ncbi:hypothetical protein OG579_18795 [Williamsia herbipolensis]|uniref:Uncharacterized protein n=1 Tax=Williamsia herbipolensis TaxID=1603258 RepID=A0AAU4K127_9NOCA|nr:hypothetical protein [Williamsia herbipolensis]
MTDPHSAIPEHAQPQSWRRYENWRARRYERLLAKNATRWPRLRNRRWFRRLVVLLAMFLLLLLVAAVIAFFTNEWLFFIPYLVSLSGILATLVLLKTVTGSVADAPVSALDEIQLAQRNSARSIGYLVLFTLSFIPFMMLIVMGSAFTLVSGRNVYGIGVLLITTTLIGTCTPTMLTSWWMADPDPEDFDQLDEFGETSAPTVEEQPGPADPPGPPTPAATQPHPTAHDDPPTPATW